MVLPAAALGVLNHLLDQTPGAHKRLRAHAGQRACLALGSTGLSFLIDEEGRLVESADDGQAVTIRLPADALLRLPHQGLGVLREARIEGDAALAETLGQVLKSLRWDVAEDLSRVVGDVAAERIVGAAKDTLSRGNDMAARLATSAAEYVADEAGMLVRPSVAAPLAGDIDTLRDDVARLQKRIELLERRRIAQPTIPAVR